MVRKKNGGKWVECENVKLKRVSWKTHKKSENWVGAESSIDGRIRGVDSGQLRQMKIGGRRFELKNVTENVQKKM